MNKIKKLLSSWSLASRAGDSKQINKNILGGDKCHGENGVM